MSNSVALTGLVDSINKNKKFGGLLNYSVNCVVNLITPPNPEAAINTRQLAKSGGLQAIISATELHAGNDNLLDATKAILSACSEDEECLAIMQETGICSRLLELAGKNPAAIGLRQIVLNITDKCANTIEAQEKLVIDGAIPSLLSLLSVDSQSKDDASLELLRKNMSVLSKLSTIDGAVEQIVGSGGLLQCLNLLKANVMDETLSANAMSLLCKASNNPSAIDILKQHDGVNTIVAAMERHYALNELLDGGGVVLGHLCSQNDIADAIETLKNTNSTEAQKRHAAAIVSNLAFDDDMLNTIIHEGGITTLLALIESGDAPSNIADICIRAIGRLGNSDVGLQQLLGSNAIKTILSVLDNDNLSPDSLASALLTFKTLSASDDGLDAIVNSGGLDKILKAIGKVKGDEQTMGITLSCLDEMIANPKIFEVVNTGDNLTMVLQAVNNYPEATEITKHAASIFSRMCNDDNRLNEMCTDDNVKLIFNCLRLNKGNENAVINCFEVISKMLYKKIQFSAIIPDFAQVLAGALKRHEGSQRVIELGVYVCSYTYDDQVLQQQRKHLKKCSRDLKFVDAQDSKDYIFAIETINVLEYFGLQNPAIETIGEDGFVKDFIKFVTDLSNFCIEECKSAHNSIYIATMAAMGRLVSASAIFANKIAISGIAKIISKFEDNHIKSPQAIAGANILASIMKNDSLSPDAIDRLFMDGSVAYILATSASNPEDVQLKQNCIDALTALCRDEDTSSRVIRSVGPKVLLASGLLDAALASLADNDANVLNSLALLTAASKIPKLVNAIVDNGVLKSLQSIISNNDCPWFEAVDPTTGKTYYYNKSTGETSWDKPDADISKAFVPATKLFNLVTSKVNPDQFIKQGGISSLISMTNMLLATSGEESKAAILSSLETLASLAKQNCQKCLDKGAIEMLVDALNKYPDDPDIVNACATIVEKLSRSPEGKIAIANSEVLTKIIEILKNNPSNQIAGKAIVSTLDNLCNDVNSVGQVAANMDGSAAIQRYIAANPDDTQSQAAADRILNATALRNRKSTVTLEDSVQTVTPGYADRNPKDVVNALQLITRTSLLDANAMEKLIDDGVAENVLGICIDTNVSPEVAEEAVDVIVAMHENGKVQDLLLLGNNVPKLIDLARCHVDNPKLVRKIMRLLTRLAINDNFKLKIVSLNGVDFIVEVIWKYLENVPLLASLVSVLANLSFNNLDVARVIINANAVGAVEAVMQNQLNQMSLLSKCLTTLSNLMFQNDDHTRIICKACGDEIVHMIRKYGENPKVLASGLRALGTLVYCEDNIGIIVGEGATLAIVDGMKKNQENEETLLMAVHCLSNLSAANMPATEAPDSCGKDFHPPRNGELTLDIMVQEGAIDILLATMRDFEYNGALGIACMEVLHGLCETHAYAKRAFDLGAASIILNLLQQHDWDHEIVAAGFGCLSVLGETVIYELDAGVDKVLSEDDVKNLATLITSIDSDEYQVAFSSICSVLKLFLSDDDHGADSGKFFVDNGVLKALIHLMKTHLNVSTYLLECTPVLATFAHIDEFAQYVAKSSIHLITEAMKIHAENSQVLTGLFNLMGSLAFENENLPLIVQYDGPAVIVDTICANPTDANMVLSAIHTLENIAMCNDEYCEIVLAHGGKDCCEALAEAYEDNQEILNACKSTMLTFNAMVSGSYNTTRTQEVKTRVRGMTHRHRDSAQKATSVFLEKYRRRILDGCTITKHHKSNAPRTRTIYVTPDFRLICWKEVGAKKNKGELAFNVVQDIIPGATTKALCRKHLMRSRPKPDCCFTIKGKLRDLDLEFQNKKDRDLWLTMFNSCIEFRKHKGLE
eukprot:g9914.t1